MHLLALLLLNLLLGLQKLLQKFLLSVIVQATLALGAAILQTASLGFLGLGAQPPAAEWGADVSINLDFVRSAPWVALAPGAGILLAVMAFNLIGDGLAEWLDPRRRPAQ